MTLVREHRGILARIRQDSTAVGWYLYKELPKGESRDHLQDTMYMAILQAAEDYSIPRVAWRETETIHVSLLGEGTDVWRPVAAIPLGGTLYKIPVDTEIPGDENWQFRPGGTVRCTTKTFIDGERVIAVEGVGENGPNQITGRNACGPRQFPIPTPPAARVGQFWR